MSPILNEALCIYQRLTVHLLIHVFACTFIKLTLSTYYVSSTMHCGYSTEQTDTEPTLMNLGVH